MPIANLFLSSYVAVEHLALRDGSSLQETYKQDAGLQAVHVNIQPSDYQTMLLYGGAYGKSYTIYTTASGILETDRVTTVSGSDTPKQFIVKGRQFFDYGLGQHVEVYVEQILV